MSSNTTRIAKNTLMLYFRQILIMLVSLYTVRVVLETLGVEDYGIYNVVAGVVTMFGFLSNAMATATQRYLAFEIGRNDFEQLKKIFSLSFTIYILIAILVLIIAETAGLWFISNKLSVPVERKYVALWVYQTSIISFLFTILTAPYMAAIIANEDMNIYACISIIDMILKLVSVFLLRYVLFDKLWLYSILICIVTIINMVIYRTICIVKYQECKLKFYWNKILFKKIMSYTGWNLFGASVGVFKFQIVNILLNQFFNPVIIAARGIASSVNSAVMSFSHAFSVAIRPQIIKSYATGNKKEMISLVFLGSKATYFLMYLFTLPFFMEMPVILEIWLKNPPEYAILFTRLTLIDTLIDSISYPMQAAAQATGKISLYQSIIGGILLLNFPIAFVFLSAGFQAWIVMIVAIGLTCAAFVIRLILVKRLIDFSIGQFIKNVMVPIILVSSLSAILPLIIHNNLSQGIKETVVTLIICICSVCFCIYLCGLTSLERKKINKKIWGRIA